MEDKERRDGEVGLSSNSNDGMNTPNINLEHIKKAINILREVTRIVKSAPFVYTAILLLDMVLYIPLNDAVLDIIDRTVFISPFIVLFMFVLSYKLKFCNWYRLQCAIPLIPQSFDFIDTHIYEYGSYTAVLNTFVIIAILFLSLMNIYFVFIKGS